MPPTPDAIGHHSTTLEWSPGSQICELTDMMMPGAEAHIDVLSQDEIHNNPLFPDSTPANSENDVCRDSIL